VHEPEPRDDTEGGESDSVEPDKNDDPPMPPSPRALREKSTLGQKRKRLAEAAEEACIAGATTPARRHQGSADRE
jgi:hypothetical protein